MSVGPEFSYATKPVTSKVPLICRMGHSRANVRNLPAINTRVRVGDMGKGRKGHERQKERRQQTMLDARGVKCKSGVLRS